MLRHFDLVGLTYSGSWATVCARAHALSRVQEALYNRSLTIATLLGETHPKTLTFQADFGVFLQKGELGRSSAPHPPPLAADPPANHGIVCFAAGRHAEAETHLANLVRKMEQCIGAEHAETMRAARNLGVSYMEMGNFALADETFASTYARQLRAPGHGEFNPRTVRTLECMAESYAKQGKYSQARETYVQAIAGFTKKLGATHPATQNAERGLAALPTSDSSGAISWLSI